MEELDAFCAKELEKLDTSSCAEELAELAAWFCWVKKLEERDCSAITVFKKKSSTSHFRHPRKSCTNIYPQTQLGCQNHNNTGIIIILASLKKRIQSNYLDGLESKLKIM